MIRRIFGISLLAATIAITACESVPAPEWGPQEHEDIDGKKSYSWGAGWEWGNPADSRSSASTIVGQGRETDPGLLITIETLPHAAPATTRYYKIKVIGTTGTLTNAVRTFTTLQGAIDAGEEFLDDAGFTGVTDMQNRDDLEAWLTSEWISAGAYYVIFGS
jgi:hypothetical protein